MEKRSTARWEIETKGRGTIMLGKPNNEAPALEAYNEAL